jgi:hypothetical protein
VQGFKSEPVHVCPGGQSPMQAGNTPPHARSVVVVVLVDVLGVDVDDVEEVDALVVLDVVLATHTQGSSS